MITSWRLPHTLDKWPWDMLFSVPGGHREVPILLPIHDCGCARGWSPLQRTSKDEGCSGHSALLPARVPRASALWDPLGHSPELTLGFNVRGCAALGYPMATARLCGKAYVFFLTKKFWIFQKESSFSTCLWKQSALMCKFSPGTVVLLVHVFVTESHCSYLKSPKLGYFTGLFCRKRSVLKVTSWVFLAPLPVTTCSLRTLR